MQSIERRIAALETKTNPYAGFPDTIIITALTAGKTKADIRVLSHDVGGVRQQWERGQHESEQEFRDRASREAHRNEGRIPILIAG